MPAITADYLRRVGNDHAASGAEFTAEDYHKAADRIEALEAELALRVAPPVDLYALGGLLCNALEGGSNYWARIEEYKRPSKPYQWDLGRDFPHIDYPTSPDGAVVFSANGDARNEEINGRTRWTLDRAAMLQGLRVMAEKYPKHYARWVAQTDDANTGDVFLQCCLFGEVVYG